MPLIIRVPGLAGSHYRRKAVEAARHLVRAVRYTEFSHGSLEVGIGVASGEEFVGNVGGGGYKDFAAVGDVTNTAARLTSSARNGQIVVDQETYEAVAQAFPDATREELAARLKERHGVGLHPGNVSRHLKRLGLSLKKKSCTRASGRPSA